MNQLKIPKIVFKGFNTFEKFYKPSINNIYWTGSINEAKEYTEKHDNSGIVIHYLPDSSKIKIFDFYNTEHTKIFGNFFETLKHEWKYSFHAREGHAKANCFVKLNYMLYKDYFWNYLKNDIEDINKIIKNFEQDTKTTLDKQSIVMINQIYNAIKSTKSLPNDLITITNSIILPVYAKVIKQHGFNTIQEYQHDDNNPSYAFISDEMFLSDKTQIYIIKNSDSIHALYSPLSNLYKFLNSIDIYKNYDFDKIVEKIKEISNNDINFKKSANDVLNKKLKSLEEIDKYTIDINSKKYIKNVIIPKSIIKIGREAFLGCSSLESIIIPNSVIEIGMQAFYGCSSLKNINIPNSVKVIGKNAFGDLPIESITIPNSITKISDKLFSSCDLLKTVNIPNSVVEIGEGAFSYCDSLKTITIPDSVNVIGKNAFDVCKNLKQVIFSKNSPLLNDIKNGKSRSWKLLKKQIFIK